MREKVRDISPQPAPAPTESAIALALRRDVLVRALRYAAIVGTILIAINHADALVRGDITAGRLLRIALTYCVPYAVTTLASIQAIRGEASRARPR